MYKVGSKLEDVNSWSKRNDFTCNIEAAFSYFYNDDNIETVSMLSLQN